jgi:hypothetical protein
LPKRTPSKLEPPGPSAAPEILQFKVWLLGISPMIWRRVQVPASMTLRELHGVIQVAMGWEGIHLFQFTLRAKRFGSLDWQLDPRMSHFQSFACAWALASAMSTTSMVHGSTRCASRAGMRLTLRQPIPFAWMGMDPARQRTAAG